MRCIALCVLLFAFIDVYGQQPTTPAEKWADSVYKSLTDDQRIAQLMVVRLSTIDMKTKNVTFFDDKVADLILKYNIGGVCLFQGAPEKQAVIVNSLQSLAKTPLLMCIDAEWGVGMRLLDSVMPLPKQMMLGAMKDSSIVYRYGQLVAEQCKRLGVQVNYAPVVDVNNNADNPVINDRSFGEDKFKVANFAIQYMKGLQESGVMACAKHFPGHGDVTADSHYDLPVVNKTIAGLDTLELYPFKRIFEAGVSSTMVAHLFIPSVDSTKNTAVSLSKNAVTGLLRDSLQFDGISFTDALDMQGVKKYFPSGAASAQALIAGNDMLCLPEDVPIGIQTVNESIKNGLLSRKDIEKHCKKVLMAKFKYGLNNLKPANTINITAALNSGIPEMRKLVAENAITLLTARDKLFFPLNSKDSIAYIGIGLKEDNQFARRIRAEQNAAVHYFDYTPKNEDSTQVFIDMVVSNYRKVVIGIHNTNRPPLNNFGISPSAVNVINSLQQRSQTITFLFGNAYAAKNWCFARNLVVCYEDDSIVQNVAIDMLQGRLPYKGVLPVTICEEHVYGSGLTSAKKTDTKVLDKLHLNRIDSIANDAIAKNAMPGCMIVVLQDGKVTFEKAYGFFTFEKKDPVTTSSIYDVASITKICATTIALMKLYDEGKLDINKTLGDYLPWVQGTDKALLTIKSVLLHEAGLPSSMQLYKGATDANKNPKSAFFRKYLTENFSTPVARGLFLRNDWRDSLNKTIANSKIGKGGYVYSDIDFIFLGMVVESLSGITLDQYVAENFYNPMGLQSLGFKPLNRFAIKNIVPTEVEKYFRKQLLRGTVHDAAAAMYGQVAGHAGLFGNATDLAFLMQMLNDEGSYKGKEYLKKETVRLFTSYQSDLSRRGFGFDKPEKNNEESEQPYPAKWVSPQTFGHTGFTGTCAWADPEHNLVYVFLSNRVYPNGNSKLIKMNVRHKIHDSIYSAIRNADRDVTFTSQNLFNSK